MTVEVAMSVALLITAGLMIRAVWRLQSVDPGFRAQGVLTLRTALPRPEYDHPVRRVQFYQRVLMDVRRLPGVEAAAYASGLPMVMTGGVTGIAIPGREIPRDQTIASRRFVTSQYFRTMGIPILRGRDIDDGDTGDRAYVSVVSESFVKRYWPNEDGIGKVFESRGEARTIVGVVGDVKVRGVERTNEPQVYWAPAQVQEGILSFYDPRDLVIRFSGESAPLLGAVREIVRAADPDQPISDVRMLDDVVAGETATRRSLLRVLGALAGIALLLSAVGIHGLLAYMVSQRSHEIGVRLALGAEPASVARMVLAEGVRLGVIGIVVGIAVAYASARGMSVLLFGVQPGDPATFAVAVGLALVVTLVGAVVPAVRAIRVSPMTALRAQ